MNESKPQPSDPSVPREELTDKDVIELVLAGKTEFFAMLYRRYRNLVYAQAMSLLGQHEQVEDIIQEVFTAAYLHLDRLTRPEAFAACVSSITRHKCLNQFRRRRLKVTSLDALREHGFEPSAAPVTPEDPTAERLALVELLLPRLPDKYREILELHYMQRVPYQHLVDRLGVSMATIKSRLFHARKALLREVRREVKP